MLFKHLEDVCNDGTGTVLDLFLSSFFKWLPVMMREILIKEGVIFQLLNKLDNEGHDVKAVSDKIWKHLVSEGTSPELQLQYKTLYEKSPKEQAMIDAHRSAAEDYKNRFAEIQKKLAARRAELEKKRTENIPDPTLNLEKTPEPTLEKTPEPTRSGTPGDGEAELDD